MPPRRAPAEDEEEEEVQPPRVRQRRKRMPAPSQTIGRNPPASTSAAGTSSDTAANRQILFLAADKLRVGLDIDKRGKSFELRSHKMELPFHEAIESRLVALGLIHVAQLGNVNLDQSLLKVLIEFWRPETHTFHFPIGEMTVTLQDVAFLFGLPTTGMVVTGRSTGSWQQIVERDLLPGAVQQTSFGSHRNGFQERVEAHRKENPLELQVAHGCCGNAFQAGGEAREQGPPTKH